MKKVKQHLVIVAALMLGSFCYGQSQAEKDQPIACLEMETYVYTMEPGSEHNIPVSLIRTEEKNKSKFNGLKTMGPKEIQIEIDKPDRKVDQYVMSVKVPANALPKKHFVVLVGEGINANRIKGTTFSITVVGKETVAKK